MLNANLHSHLNIQHVNYQYLYTSFWWGKVDGVKRWTVDERDGILSLCWMYVCHNRKFVVAREHKISFCRYTSEFVCMCRTRHMTLPLKIFSLSFFISCFSALIQISGFYLVNLKLSEYMTPFFSLSIHIEFICVLPIDLIFLCGCGGAVAFFFCSFLNGIQSMVARAIVPSPSNEEWDDDCDNDNHNVIRQYNVYLAIESFGFQQ